jgi:hypothetical protein
VCIKEQRQQPITELTKPEKRELSKSIKRNIVRKDNFIRIVESAQRWKDVRELTGNNDHPMITRAMRLCGLDGDKGYAWCAACWVEICNEAMVVCPISARVMDWFAQNVVWVDRWGEIPDRIDVRGMFGGVYYSRLGRLAHLVFIVGEDRNNYYTYQGNTSAMGAIEWNDGEFEVTDEMISEIEREAVNGGFHKKIIRKDAISALADYCLIGEMFSDEYDWYLLKFYN